LVHLELEVGNRGPAAQQHSPLVSHTVAMTSAATPQLLADVYKTTFSSQYRWFLAFCGEPAPNGLGKAIGDGHSPQVQDGLGTRFMAQESECQVEAKPLAVVAIIPRCA
jgi:hypothetical protein